MLLLSRSDVERLLNIDELISGLARAMSAVSLGEVVMPARAVTPVADADAVLSAMPAYLPGTNTLTAKLVTVFPHNLERGLDSHQAVVLLFDPTNGTPLAMMEGAGLTATRTAAGSALATRLLAREESSVLTIMGTGVQAWAHAVCCSRVRPVRHIRVYGRSLEKAEQLARRITATLGIEAAAVATLEEATVGADIICGATHANEPVIRGDLLSPGTHVNSVGQNFGGREVDEAAVLRSTVVVESRAAALTTQPGGATELTWPIRDGVMTADHIHAEIGEIVLGKRAARTTPDEITLYKSVGIAVQDAVAAQIVFDAAKREGAGIELAF